MRYPETRTLHLTLRTEPEVIDQLDELAGPRWLSRSEVHRACLELGIRSLAAILARTPEETEEALARHRATVREIRRRLNGDTEANERGTRGNAGADPAGTAAPAEG